MNRIARIFLPALAALALPAALGAQPFRSDVQGPIPTGSGIAGMGYPVVPTRDIEGSLFRRVGSRTAFRTRAIADAILAEGAAAHHEACSGTLRPPVDMEDAEPLPVDAQRVLCSVLNRPDYESLARVICALGGNLDTGEQDAAERLVSALQGLATLETVFLDSRQRFVAADRWAIAFRLYEEYLDTAPDAVLAPPSPELRVISAILRRMVDAGMRAADR